MTLYNRKLQKSGLNKVEGNFLFHIKECGFEEPLVSRVSHFPMQFLPVALLPALLLSAIGGCSRQNRAGDEPKGLLANQTLLKGFAANLAQSSQLHLSSHTEIKRARPGQCWLGPFHMLVKRRENRL